MIFYEGVDVSTSFSHTLFLSFSFLSHHTFRRIEEDWSSGLEYWRCCGIIILISARNNYTATERAYSRLKIPTLKVSLCGLIGIQGMSPTHAKKRGAARQEFCQTWTYSISEQISLRTSSNDAVQRKISNGNMRAVFFI